MNTKLIVNLTRDSAVCEGAIADRPLTRMRGLLGRPALPAGEGLLLRPAGSIHTAFMRFSIDALFLDRRLRVLAIAEEVRPWRIAGRRGARAVLELAAGESARLGVEIGDQLALRERSSASDSFPHEVTSVEPALARSNGRAHGAVEEPLSVLVISHDHRFRTMSAFLLRRRGCVVTRTADVNRAAELVDRDRVDVIVLDASECPVVVSQATTDIGRLTCPVGLVIVAEEATGDRVVTAERASGDFNGRPVLAKWGPLEELLNAIERAKADRRRRT
jgi:uncharacterized membrane protein (UPF0127 family)/CheY-like chemotaxis protein